MADRLWTETLTAVRDQPADKAALLFLRTGLLIMLLLDRRGGPSGQIRM